MAVSPHCTSLHFQLWWIALLWRFPSFHFLTAVPRRLPSQIRHLGVSSHCATIFYTFKPVVGTLLQILAQVTNFFVGILDFCSPPALPDPSPYSPTLSFPHPPPGPPPSSSFFLVGGGERKSRILSLKMAHRITTNPSLRPGRRLMLSPYTNFRSTDPSTGPPYAPVPPSILRRHTRSTCDLLPFVQLDVGFGRGPSSSQARGRALGNGFGAPPTQRNLTCVEMKPPRTQALSPVTLLSPKLITRDQSPQGLHTHRWNAGTAPPSRTSPRPTVQLRPQSVQHVRGSYVSSSSLTGRKSIAAVTTASVVNGKKLRTDILSHIGGVRDEIERLQKELAKVAESTQHWVGVGDFLSPEQMRDQCKFSFRSCKSTAWQSVTFTRPAMCTARAQASSSLTARSPPFSKRTDAPDSSSHGEVLTNGKSFGIDPRQFNLMPSVEKYSTESTKPIWKANGHISTRYISKFGINGRPITCAPIAAPATAAFGPSSRMGGYPATLSDKSHPPYRARSTSTSIERCVRYEQLGYQHQQQQHQHHQHQHQHQHQQPLPQQQQPDQQRSNSLEPPGFKHFPQYCVQTSKDRYGNDHMMNGVMEAVTPYQSYQALNEENAVFSVGQNAMQSTDAKQSKPFVASHYQAYRIQRAWRLHKWRTNFKKYGENRGWVGTLDWLQKHKLLYGAELAEPEDVSTWEKARRDAPLDSIVDPWGSERLRDHLHLMRFGDPPPPDNEKLPHSESRPAVATLGSWGIRATSQRRENSLGPLGLTLPTWRRPPSLGTRILRDVQFSTPAINLAVTRSPVLTLRAERVDLQKAGPIVPPLSTRLSTTLLGNAHCARFNIPPQMMPDSGRQSLLNDGLSSGSSCSIRTPVLSVGRASLQPPRR